MRAFGVANSSPLGLDRAERPVGPGRLRYEPLRRRARRSDAPAPPHPRNSRDGGVGRRTSAARRTLRRRRRPAKTPASAHGRRAGRCAQKRTAGEATNRLRRTPRRQLLRLRTAARSSPTPRRAQGSPRCNRRKRIRDRLAPGACRKARGRSVRDRPRRIARRGSACPKGGCCEPKPGSRDCETAPPPRRGRGKRERDDRKRAAWLLCYHAGAIRSVS